MNKPFRNRFNAPRLQPDQATRQGRASTLAFMALGGEGAVAFLNTHDEALGARPLDLAIESPEGLAQVEQAIAARSA